MSVFMSVSVPVSVSVPMSWKGSFESIISKFSVNRDHGHELEQCFLNQTRKFQAKFVQNLVYFPQTGLNYNTTHQPTAVNTAFVRGTYILYVNLTQIFVHFFEWDKCLPLVWSHPLVFLCLPLFMGSRHRPLPSCLRVPLLQLHAVNYILFCTLLVFHSHF
jgi:hypothetical protein